MSLISDERVELIAKETALDQIEEAIVRLQEALGEAWVRENNLIAGLEIIAELETLDDGELSTSGEIARNALAKAKEGNAKKEMTFSTWHDRINDISDLCHTTNVYDSMSKEQIIDLFYETLAKIAVLATYPDEPITK
jgi:hypothetical protein